mmetsp:Transcript_16641/g.50171  ORF Transcript_16641/g.50171 Transcript_16641/m.50171 type:complete len:125 (+) Transcript_16641:82-456(+)
METVESLTLELSRSKPAASRLPCSLIATSQCGDFLVATQGNTLRYSHYSHKKLWPVFFSDQMADSYLQQTTLFAVRFNLKATAALLAGRACLFAVGWRVGDRYYSNWLIRYFQRHVDKMELCVI